MPENEKDPREAVEEMMQLLGGREKAEEFMAQAERAAAVDAFKGIYEMYHGLREGGFKRSEALQLLAFYIMGLMMMGDDE